MPKPRKKVPIASPVPVNLMNRFSRFMPALPWAVAGLFLAIMGFVVIRWHHIGGFGVETDFYAELVPQSRALLRGEFDPHLYGNKGPVYSFILAAVYLVVREYFYAGLVINILAAAGFLVAGYFLVKRVFNEASAVFFILAAATTFNLLNYTIQAGSDTLFLVFAALSLLFLFRDDTNRSIIISAIFASLAFLTRYNGAFLAAGAVPFLLLGTHGSFKNRLKRLGLWFAVFIVSGLPWYIPNWLATGNPVHNDNYINVMIEFYGSANSREDYERWDSLVPEGIDSLGDVIRYDPVYFVIRFVVNFFIHIYMDLWQLIGLRLALPVVFGLLLTLAGKPGKRRFLYLLFGVFAFLVLVPVFYNARFSLVLLLFWLPVAAWPFTEGRFAGFFRRFHIILPIIATALIVFDGVVSFQLVDHTLMKTDPQLVNLKDLGLRLGAVEHDPHQKVCAREPHIAHYAGLLPRMFPEKLQTLEELIAYCRENGIRYVAYTSIELSSRPNLKMLWEKQKQPGLEQVVWNKAGVIFRVNP
jgi:4-amino-4-deoxy-L-arabinose transferase-like glycosyltransferase